MATSNAQSDGAGSAAPKIWQDGSCHCGAVTFKVLHEPLEESIPIRCCNCSICHKKGYLTIYPERKEIEWLSGWDGMKNYRFGTETRDHKFCDVCGSSICIDFLGKWSVGDVIGINVRLLHGIDVHSLYLRKSDGRGWQTEFNEKHPV